MIVHSFNTSYSDQDLIDVLQNGTSIEVTQQHWKELRITLSSLPDVRVEPKANSFACQGVKEDKQHKLLMIGYDMSWHGEISWEQVRSKFKSFLARHLLIDKSSIEIEGIIFGMGTWYVMKRTSALEKALTGEAKNWNSNRHNWMMDALLGFSVSVLKAVAVKVVFGVLVIFLSFLFRDKCKF